MSPLQDTTGSPSDKEAKDAEAQLAVTDRLHGQKEQEEPGRGPHCRSGQVPPSSLSRVICIGSS